MKIDGNEIQFIKSKENELKNVFPTNGFSFWRTAYIDMNLAAAAYIRLQQMFPDLHNIFLELIEGKSTQLGRIVVGFIDDEDETYFIMRVHNEK